MSIAVRPTTTGTNTRPTSLNVDGIKYGDPVTTVPISGQDAWFALVSCPAF